VLVEDLFEDLELWYPVIRLREAGASVELLGPGNARYRGKHGLTAMADAPVESARAEEIDGLVIPGGYAPDRLRRSTAVLDLVRRMDKLGKPVAFICHAGWVPASAGILGDRHVTSFFSIRDDLENAGAHWRDSAVVVDKNLISSRDPGDLPDFCRALIALLAGAPDGGWRRTPS
jgi:protease I